jgi:hypothetical protein
VNGLLVLLLWCNGKMNDFNKNARGKIDPAATMARDPIRINLSGDSVICATA